MSDEAADLSSWMKQPHRIAVDGKGYVWRQFADMWSMAPVNADNSPIPQPIRYYVSADDLRDDFLIAAVAATAKGDYDRAEAFRIAADYMLEWHVNPPVAGYRNADSNHNDPGAGDG